MWFKTLWSHLTSTPENESTSQFWARIATPGNPWFWLAGAIIATVVGDSFFQILSLEAFEMSPGYLAYRLVLLAVFTMGLFFLVPRIEWYWAKRRGGATIEPRTEVPSPRALIAYVSANPTGPYRTAVNRFIAADKAAERQLRKVYLVHSPESLDVTRVFEKELDGYPELNAEKDGLRSSFSDLKAIHTVTRQAIERALAAGYAASDIVIDVTGGTGICTAGAVLAAMESDTILTYIQMVPGRPLEQGDMIAVDVSWAMQADSSIAPTSGENQHQTADAVTTDGRAAPA